MAVIVQGMHGWRPSYLSYPLKKDCCSEEQSLLSFRGLGCCGGEEDAHNVTFWEAAAAEESKIKLIVIRTICGAPCSDEWL